MAQRRSSAPVQQDPIRQRLGKPAHVRDVTCPSCGIVFATARRWQQRCPDCGHGWIDRSNRTLLDAWRDARLELFTGLFMAAAIILAFGGFAVWVFWLFSEATDVWGWERTWGLGAFFAGSFIALLVLGRLMRH